SLALRLAGFGLDLLADVLPRHGETQRPAVPFEPVERDVVADRAVADQVCATPMQQVDGGQQRRTKVIAPRRSGCPGRSERLGRASASEMMLRTDVNRHSEP